MNLGEYSANPLRLSLISSCPYFMVSFSNVFIVLSVFICFILVFVHWSSCNSQWIDPSCTLSLNCEPPFTGPPFSWEDPVAWVGSFTQKNCTCSESSWPITCWAQIELISQVEVFRAQGSRIFWPKPTRREDLRFLFL